MTPAELSPRMKLVREATILQLKLLVDGLRDALLIPLSLVAAAIGLLRGGDDCDSEFRRVIKLGRRSERWINLFGDHRPLNHLRSARSMDTIIDEVENVVVKQYQKGRNAPASAAGETESDDSPR